MPLRPTLLGMSLFGICVGVAALGAQSCSSGTGQQDQYYDTDVAADYGGPEVGSRADSSTQSDNDANAGDDASTQNFDAGSKDTNESADATADMGASDAASSL